MIVKFIVGYLIGIILTLSVLFGLQMISLYEVEIKRWFYKTFKKGEK